MGSMPTFRAMKVLYLDSSRLGQAFHQVDEQRHGWLSQEQVAVAFREVINKLTGREGVYVQDN